MLGQGPVGRTAAEIRRDVGAARSRDPAAAGVGWLEILLTWPGVQALLAHRFAHALQRSGVPLLPRLIAALARLFTGIEIHPAARIGPGLFIDHGMGVVIGETAQLGADVTIYQGVTLGGTGFATGKRHPTVEDNVTIGSGAKLLGPIRVGHGSKIGANSVVVHDVPPNSTVVGNPGHPVRVEGRRPEGPDADWVHLPDPIAEAIKGLARRIEALELEAAAGRGERDRAEGERGRPEGERVPAEGDLGRGDGERAPAERERGGAEGERDGFARVGGGSNGGPGGSPTTESRPHGPADINRAIGPNPAGG